MSRDLHQDIRRQLAAEAYEWRKQAMRQNRPHLHAVDAVADAADDAAPEQAAGTTEALASPIVVGYDGSAGTLPALAWALAEAQGRRVPLVIVRAWQWDDELAEPGLIGPEDKLPELAYNTLPDWVRQADNVSVVLAPHAAGPAIVEHAADAAMIVVGRRRLGPIQRAWLGSTSSYVMQHAPCPVVVVPEIAQATERPAAAPTEAERDHPANDGAPV